MLVWVQLARETWRCLLALSFNELINAEKLKATDVY